MLRSLRRAAPRAFPASRSQSPRDITASTSKEDRRHRPSPNDVPMRQLQRLTKLEQVPGINI